MILGPQHTHTHTGLNPRQQRTRLYFWKKISHTHRCVCRCVCSHWTMWQLVSCVQELIWYLSSPQSICVGLCGLKPTVLLKIYIFLSSYRHRSCPCLRPETPVVVVFFSRRRLNHRFIFSALIIVPSISRMKIQELQTKKKSFPLCCQVVVLFWSFGLL